MKNQVLVTGATGFTGSHLCRRLVNEGFSVRAIIRDEEAGQALRKRGIEPVVGDLRNRDSLSRAVQGIEIVYHLAASFRAGRARSIDLRATNVLGTRDLVEAAGRAGVQRFVHCSSVGVHGDVQSPPADETTSMNPGDAYQLSKLDGEIAAKDAAAKAGMPLVIFRPAGIYGPGDLRFLKLVKAIGKPVFPMIGNGKSLYQMVYVEDLLDGVLKCGKRPEAVGNTYILTSAHAVTMNEVFRTVAKALGRQPMKIHVPVAPVYLLSMAVEFICAPFKLEPPLFRRRLDPFRKNRSFSIEKARKELGYSPKTTLAEGFRHTVRWYRQQGMIR